MEQKKVNRLFKIDSDLDLKIKEIKLEFQKLGERKTQSEILNGILRRYFEGVK